jgi:S1-C subfamily serine protease
MKRTKKKASFLGRLLVLPLVLLVAVSVAVGALPATASAAETPAVDNARKGVYLLNVYYRSTEGQTYLLQYGSGFFVNDTTLITCYHVCNISAEYGAVIQAYFGDKDFRSRLIYRVVLMRDLEAELEFNQSRASEMTDFAALVLKDQVSPPHALSLGSSTEVKQTEQVWTLGFPTVDLDFRAGLVTDLTADDVAVGSGTVSQLLDSGGVSYVQHDATMSSGNSGGPLVNSTGAVLGINNAVSAQVIGGDYNYSVSIDQVKAALDTLGIEYTLAASTAVQKGALQELIAQTESAAADLSKYTNESATAFAAALTAAKEVNESEESTQSQVDIAAMNLGVANRGLVKKLSFVQFLLIAVAVVAVAAVVVAILMMAQARRRKDKVVIPPISSLGASTLGSLPAVQSLPPQGSVSLLGQTTSVAQGVSDVPRALVTPAGIDSPASPGIASPSPAVPVLVRPAPSLDAIGGGDTTVLNPAMDGKGVLGPVPSTATLLRVSNNERIHIDKPEFTVGKERGKVNFAITNNNAISRIHVRIVFRGGQYFISDLKTTNYTWVNGEMVPPGTEMPLKKDDRIMLADEEFIFDC